jgi:cation transport protein ChaC
MIDIHLKGRRQRGVAFVVDRSHPQYVRGLSVHRQVAIIRAACGPSGANIEYVLNTLAELKRLGVSNMRLRRLRELLELGP